MDLEIYVSRYLNMLRRTIFLQRPGIWGQTSSCIGFKWAKIPQSWHSPFWVQFPIEMKHSGFRKKEKLICKMTADVVEKLTLGARLSQAV